jgi:ferredoxin
MKVPWVDQDECTSCELCTETAPNTFRMNDDDVAEVFNPQGDPEDLIQQAIDDCPAECIHWKEE